MPNMKKKLTNRQKKTIRNKKEAKTYLQLLNRAYKIIKSDLNVICFDLDDYLILPYLKTGFKKGWNILNNNNIIKEINCNSLCMTISILNYKIFNTDKDKLTPIQKLYLFFISYLIDDNTIPKKTLDLKHALRKL